MKKFTQDWWTWRYNECAEEEFVSAVRQIGSIVNITGQWNKEARVLEVQCGLGIMSHYMYDHGYKYFYGIDGYRGLERFWEEGPVLATEYADDMPFKNKFFDLVAWFTMSDGRIEEEDWEDVIDEMARVTKNKMILKPFTKFDKKKDEELLALMMRKGWSCEELTPVLWHYYFVRE